MVIPVTSPGRRPTSQPYWRLRCALICAHHRSSNHPHHILPMALRRRCARFADPAKATFKCVTNPSNLRVYWFRFIASHSTTEPNSMIIRYCLFYFGSKWNCRFSCVRFRYWFTWLMDVSATEIRCQEMSKGGLAYEVILAEPVSSPIVPKRPVSPGSKTPSVEEIEEKLKAAEERRLVIVLFNVSLL